MPTNFSQFDNTQDNNANDPTSLEQSSKQMASALQATQPIYATRQLPRTLNKFDLFTFSALTTLYMSPIILASAAGYSALIYWILASLCILPYIMVARWLSSRTATRDEQYSWVALLGSAQWGTIARLFLWLWCLFTIMSSLVGCLIILQLYAAYIFQAPIDEFGALICFMGIIVILSFLPLHKLKGILLGMLILSIALLLIAGLTGYWWVLNGHPPMTSLSTLQLAPNNIGFFGVALGG
ncbi:hypothetical protein [Ktedonospora formicarum]|uniref:Uncharacterized protein n=1 Tax=Ktedonospora formicarum TaxID=2778364 RepID=A0A8J3I4R4_9CHLR|nr:hypothetical protein [Ktedonospora formicarum]GHO50237.1 hypothetical protein KSX_84000 [Ktedonospora formicarum]